MATTREVQTRSPIYERLGGARHPSQGMRAVQEKAPTFYGLGGHGYETRKDEQPRQ